MIYTVKELLNSGETAYSIRNKLNKGDLFSIERGIYSTIKKSYFINESYISKKYPNAIFTGISAFYFYGLTDCAPEYFYVATKQHSFPIRRQDIKQSYQDESFFQIGSTIESSDDGMIRIYDLERTLIELFRQKEKYPREIYYEVLNSFRKIKEKLDFYKINQYLKSFSNGESILQRIKEAI